MLSITLSLSQASVDMTPAEHRICRGFRKGSTAKSKENYLQMK